MNTDPTPSARQFEGLETRAWIDAVLEARVHELSRTGLSLTSDERLQAGALHTLELRHENRVTVRALCQWCHLIDGSQHQSPLYQAGFRFDESSDVNPARFGGEPVPLLSASAELRRSPRFVCRPPIPGRLHVRSRIQMIRLSLTDLEMAMETVPLPERRRRIQLELPNGSLALTGRVDNVRQRSAPNRRRIYLADFRFDPYSVETRRQLIDFLEAGVPAG